MNEMFVTTGVGKSSLIAELVAATWRSLGERAHYEHATEMLHGGLGYLRGGDHVYCFSQSGRTDEVIAVAKAARELSCEVIAVTGAARSPLTDLADEVYGTWVPPRDELLGLLPAGSLHAQLEVGLEIARTLFVPRAKMEQAHPAGSIGQILKERQADE